jgi:hypothetical protein
MRSTAALVHDLTQRDGDFALAPAAGAVAGVQEAF